MPSPRLRVLVSALLVLPLLLPGCGGGGEDPGGGQTPTKPAAIELREVASDTERYEARIRFPEPRRIDSEHDGVRYTELVFDGLEPGTALGHDDAAGAPGIPMMVRNLAVPIGATPRLVVVDVQTEALTNLLLRPHQRCPVDGEGERPPVKDGELPPPELFEDYPFELDEEAYASDASRPSEVVTLTSIGRMRDLELVQVAIAPLSYNAARREAILHTDVTFRVEFDGSRGAFLPAQAADPFEESNFAHLHRAAAINGRLLYEDLRWAPGVIDRRGAELLIVTHPEFIEAAQKLAEWKREKGITTQVYRVGDPMDGGVGSTKEEIRDFLRGRYETASPRPSYVLLLGDAEFIPPFYRSTSYSINTGTDLDYSLMNPGDLLADLGLGRIPVDTEAEAHVVVDKIIGYERTPPLAIAGFYERAVIAAYFQAARTDVDEEGVTSRGYIRVAEQIRDGMMADGYTVDRVYHSDTSYHGGYTGDATPRRFRNLDLLPSDLGPGYSWSADTSDVTDAINEGCFLLIHRDHGGKDGWVSPQFQTADVPSLTNGSLLPVLFSVDCATGLFDNETAGGSYGSTVSGVYFLEALLRLEGGGVVGALGDTRDSPTWANNALTRGFGDAVFPEVLPDVGPSEPIRRLADILNYGKLYMFSQVGVDPVDADDPIPQSLANTNNVLWHVFGDPTLEIWTEFPFHLPRGIRFELLGRQLTLDYAVNGAEITVQQNGTAMGRARVEEGAAVIDLFDDPNPQMPLVLSAAAPNGIATPLDPVSK